MQTDVLIIGGGLAGLAAAIGLLDSGLRITLVEESETLGGRARSWTDPTTGDAIDIGPHIFLSEYPNLLRLLEILGTRDNVVWDTAEFITLIDNHRPVPMRLHHLPPPLHFLPSFLATAPVTLRDVHSSRRVLWLAMKMDDDDVQRLDDFTAAHFLRRMGVTERFRQWFWASASMAIMNVPLDHCSAGALMRLFRILIAYNDLRMGFPAVGLSDLYVPQAVRRIDAAGGRIVTGKGVRRLFANNGAATGAVLSDQTRIEARFCISSVPPQCLHAILPQEWSNTYTVFRNLTAFEPNPYISTYLWFDRKLTRATNWASVWTPTTLNYDFYDLSNIRHDWQDRRSTIASNIMYSHRAMSMSDDEIVEATAGEIADFLPQTAQAKIRHARVHRIPMAIPCPYPGTEHRRPDQRSPIKHLYLAGDWTRTTIPACMESAVISGWRAAEHVLSDAGQPRRLVVPFRQAGGITGLVARWRKTHPLPAADSTHPQKS